MSTTKSQMILDVYTSNGIGGAARGYRASAWTPWLVLLAVAATTLLPAVIRAQTAGRDALPARSQLPPGFIPPPLHPTGADLVPRELAPGVYALVSTKPPVDNSGFVVGEDGVLVIDAHINGDMAGKIIRAVRNVTDKPILYLVNTNYHGDHTFGNYAFPTDTRIVAHRATADAMRHFEAEKQFLLITVNGDTTVYADAKLRLPDLTFDSDLQIDLGGRVVEVHHFGPGNTIGDAVVYVPDARVAWTGNLVLGQGIIPFLLEGNSEGYANTIEQFASRLPVETIVPGHGPLTEGSSLHLYAEYLRALTEQVRAEVQRGRSLEQALAALQLEERFLPPPAVPVAREFVDGLHRFNVAMVYRQTAGK